VLALVLRNAVIFAGAATLAAPALAYDPCDRASERAERADAAVLSWIRSHCTNNGSCIGNPAELQQLRERALDARAERARACR
jgi:hypothetical protein